MRVVCLLAAFCIMSAFSPEARGQTHREYDASQGELILRLAQIMRSGDVDRSAVDDLLSDWESGFKKKPRDRDIGAAYLRLRSAENILFDHASYDDPEKVRLAAAQLANARAAALRNDLPIVSSILAYEGLAAWRLDRSVASSRTMATKIEEALRQLDQSKYPVETAAMFHALASARLTSSRMGAIEGFVLGKRALEAAGNLALMETDDLPQWEILFRRIAAFGIEGNDSGEAIRKRLSSELSPTAKASLYLQLSSSRKLFLCWDDEAFRLADQNFKSAKLPVARAKMMYVRARCAEEGTVSGSASSHFNAAAKAFSAVGADRGRAASELSEKIVLYKDGLSSGLFGFTATDKQKDRDRSRALATLLPAMSKENAIAAPDLYLTAWAYLSLAVSPNGDQAYRRAAETAANLASARLSVPFTAVFGTWYSAGMPLPEQQHDEAARAAYAGAAISALIQQDTQQFVAISDSARSRALSVALEREASLAQVHTLLIETAAAPLADGELMRLRESSGDILRAAVTEPKISNVNPFAALKEGEFLVYFTSSNFWGGVLVIGASGEYETIVSDRLSAAISFGFRSGGLSGEGWLDRYRRLFNGDVSVGDIPDSEFDPALDGLSQHFTLHVREALQKLGARPGDRLLIVPPGELSLIPLSLSRTRHLFESEFLPRTPDENFLVQDFQIAIAPTWASFADNELSKSQLTLITLSSDDPALTSRAEALWIADAMGQDGVDFEDAPKKDTLKKLSSYSYWHFATHGSFDTASPLDSFLELNNGSRLTLRDIRGASNGNMNPRLVFLSACETGLSEVSLQPDAFNGFPAAFLEMGADAVVATLWPVPDVAATLLTSRFYQAHIKQGQSPPEAMRTAQHWLRTATLEDLNVYIEAAEAKGILTGAGAEKLYSGIVDASSDTGAPPFARIIYWGAYVVYGK